MCAVSSMMVHGVLTATYYSHMSCNREKPPARLPLTLLLFGYRSTICRIAISQSELAEPLATISGPSWTMMSAMPTFSPMPI
ncbi:hypothetical protein LINGRAHAP2_LOCUS32412 [Linum grandiflorum]